MSDATPSSVLGESQLYNILWVLNFSLCAINRGRVYGLAYRLDNTSEDALAALAFALLALYGSVLELLASAELGSFMISDMLLAQAMANPKTARGLVGRVYAMVDQVEAAAEACQRSMIGDPDQDILDLLANTPSIRPVSQAETEPPKSGDEMYDADGDDDDWDLTDLQWISRLPFDEAHQALRDKRASATCAWLLHGQDFGNWEDSNVCATFWLRGSRKYLTWAGSLPLQ
jgi:hypothetical protein